MKNSIREIRGKIGMTQKRLATAVAMSTKSLRAVETGVKELDLGRQASIVVALTMHSLENGGIGIPFSDTFPDQLPPAAAAGISAEQADRFFALDDGPFGNPPVMTIRGFSSTPAGACGLPSFTRPAFDFVPIGQSCSGSPICKAAQ